MLAFLVLGHGYPAAALAMVGTILVMVLMGVTHPPAVSTSLIFALRSGAESEILLFGLALTMVVALVLLQRALAALMHRRGFSLTSLRPEGE